MNVMLKYLIYTRFEDICQQFFCDNNEMATFSAFQEHWMQINLWYSILKYEI